METRSVTHLSKPHLSKPHPSKPHLPSRAAAYPSAAQTSAVALATAGVRSAYRIRRYGIALCALALTLLAGCITVEGTSSGQMKKGVQEFFAYKNARLFYPDGVSGAPEDLPNLDAKARKSIEDTYRAMLTASILSHTRQRDLLSAMFERPLPEKIDARIVLNDAPLARGLPLARMEADGGLVLSTKVAQAMFRSAVLRGMQSTDLGGPRFMDADIDTFGARATNEREMIDQFNRLIEKVSNARGRGVVGDLFSMIGDDEMEGGWFEMTDFAQMSAEVENAYRAPIRFMIAHELGHLALGHFSAHPGASGGVDQALCRRQETEADLYAIALMLTMPEYRQMLAQSGGLFGDKLFLFGHDDFFRSAYDLARFAPPAGQAAEQCRYESAEQRYAFLEAAKDAIVDQDRYLTITEMLALKANVREDGAGESR